MQRLARVVIGRPRVVVLCVTIVTLILGSELRGLRPEVDLRDLIPSDHPYVLVDETINERFRVGLTAIVAVGVSQGTIYSTEVLEKIQRITEALERLDGVIPSSVLSIASENLRAIGLEEDGISVEPLMERIPRGVADLKDLREKVESHPVAFGTLVTRDGTGGIVVADFEGDVDAEALARSLGDIAGLERDLRTDVFVGGQPSALAALDSATREIVPLLILSLVIVSLIHFEAFRTIQATILPLVTAAVSVVWSMGLARLLGVRVTPWTALTTILVLSVAAGHAVQMLKRYYECLLEAGGDNASAVRMTLESVGPVMVTAGFVAAAGFASLAGFGVPAVKDFGVIAACGIVSALILEVTLIPAMRVMMRVPRARERLLERNHRLLEGLVETVSEVVTRRPGATIGVVLSLVSIVSVGIASLTVNTAFRSWFSEDDEEILADRAIREKFIGTSTVRVLFESEREGGLHEPAALRAIASAQQVLSERPEISGTISIVDYLRAAHSAMVGADGVTEIPANRSLVSQYLLILGGETVSRLISDDGRSAVIYGFARSDAVGWVKSTFERLEALGLALPEGVRIGLAGGELAQAVANNDTVVREKMKNMAQVALVILVLSSLVLRSVVGGMLVLAPLVCAALVNLGTMGWVGSWLSFATATYTSMGVSLGADFAIYYLFRVREEMAEHGLDGAVRRALTTAGQAIVFVACGIAGGYSALLLSSFKLWRELGAYVGLMMIVSALGTITLLPAIILVVRPAFLTRLTGVGGYGESRGKRQSQEAEAIAAKS